MTALTHSMIDAFPIANLHVHLPGVISAETALQLGLRNNLVKIENGKIVPTYKLPNIPDDVRYKTYADIFAEGYEVDVGGVVTNLRYDIAEHSMQTFNEFDQIMGLVQGHKYSYRKAGEIKAVGGMQNPEDLTLVLDEYLERCIAAKVLYVELKQNIYLAEVLFPHLEPKAAKKEFFDILKQAQEKYKTQGVSLYFIQCFNKAGGLKTTDAVIARANAAAEDLIEAELLYPYLFVGFDSAGNEKAELAHPKYQAEAYSRLKGGTKLDTHAGEGGHVERIMQSVEHLGVGIIGHGIQVVECKNAMRFAAEKDLLFFVCPSMNMFLGTNLNMPTGRVTVKTLWEHPFFTMLRKPIEDKYLNVSLATDNPDFGGVPYKTMLMQLAGLLPEITGEPTITPLSAEELYRCAKNSLRAISSLPERIMYEQALSSWARISKLNVQQPEVFKT